MRLSYFIQPVHPLDRNYNDILREDIASDVNTATEILENAPQKELDFFSVPKVIE